MPTSNHRQPNHSAGLGFDASTLSDAELEELTHEDVFAFEYVFCRSVGATHAEAVDCCRRCRHSLGAITFVAYLDARSRGGSHEEALSWPLDHLGQLPHPKDWIWNRAFRLGMTQEELGKAGGHGIHPTEYVVAWLAGSSDDEILGAATELKVGGSLPVYASMRHLGVSHAAALRVGKAGESANPWNVFGALRELKGTDEATELYLRRAETPGHEQPGAHRDLGIQGGEQ